MGGAPGTLTRPHSEVDFSELDENTHLAVVNMSDDEIHNAFEKMLVRYLNALDHRLPTSH